MEISNQALQLHKLMLQQKGFHTFGHETQVQQISRKLASYVAVQYISNLG
jgi:hypothetical protein